VDLQDDHGNSLAVVQPSNQKVQVPQAASGQLATNNSSDYKTIDLIQALSQGNDASSVNANAGGAISYTYNTFRGQCEGCGEFCVDESGLETHYAMFPSWCDDLGLRVR
jgi:hypothetical protein